MGLGNVDEFVRSMLKQNCFLRCNPSGGRALGNGGGGGPTSMASVVEGEADAKRDCVQGCLLADGKPIAAAHQVSLIMRMDDEFHHADVLPEQEKDRIVKQMIGLGDRLKQVCHNECLQHCQDSHAEHGSRNASCVASCDDGCKFFVDQLIFKKTGQSKQ